MVQKTENTKTEWEGSIGWDHPLVVAGFWPGHLLRDAFGYSVSGWSPWVHSHLHLCKMMNQRPWFHRDTFMSWAADPGNANDLPPKTNGQKKAIPAQPGHNPTPRKRLPKQA